MYFQITIQGNKESPDKMNNDIDSVILKLKENLIKFNENAMEEYKFTIRNQILKNDENLRNRFERVFEEITSNSIEFDRKLKLLNALDVITAEDIKTMFIKTFFDNPKKISLQIFSGNSTLNNNVSHELYGLNNKIMSSIIYDFNTHPGTYLLPFYNRTINEIYAPVVSKRKIHFIKN